MFVVGCPRSGTTLVYHILLSSGLFTYYRTETLAFCLLDHKFPNLRSTRSKRRLLDFWCGSKLFARSGLDADAFAAYMLSREWSTAADFLELTMGRIAATQDNGRWADCTPDHALYLPEIHRSFPSARIVHVIRDGRDVALSLARQGWLSPLPFDRTEPSSIAAMYWDWFVGRARADVPEGAHYCEIKFEDLVTDPEPVLARVGDFVGAKLRYADILANRVGSVRVPNTSFEGDVEHGPVGRWRRRLDDSEVARLEALMAGRLQELEYVLETEGEASARRTRVAVQKTVYQSLYAIKLWLKKSTPLGRITSTERAYNL